MKYIDYCGWYKIVKHRNGTATAFHRLANLPSKVIKIGDYKSVKSAKIGLARYCGGMPRKINNSV